MNRLVRLYASNFLTTDQILETNENLRLLDFVQENDVSNEELGIGNETWISVAELEFTYDTAPFFEAVRGFYVNSTKKMLKKFPFGDTLMDDLSVI